MAAFLNQVNMIPDFAVRGNAGKDAYSFLVKIREIHHDHTPPNGAIWTTAVTRNAIQGHRLRSNCEMRGGKQKQNLPTQAVTDAIFFFFSFSLKPTQKKNNKESTPAEYE